MQVLTASSEPLIRIDTQLGEGPIWERESGTLHFVDVGKNCIHHYHYTTKQLTTDHYDACIGSIALRKNHPGFIAGTTRGFALLPPADPSRPSSSSEPLTIGPHVIGSNPLADPACHAESPEQPNRMFNDGVCDGSGRFFCGSKTLRGEPFLEQRQPGKVYRVQKGGSDEWKIEQVLGRFTIPNGMGITSDLKTMYISDTRAPHIRAYDYEDSTGVLSAERVWVTTPYDARPDGMCLDDQDRVYVAKWSGAKVTRYLPDGTPDLEIVFPTANNITAPVFGGPDMDILFVTSGSLNEAGEDTDSEKVAKYTAAGSVFAVQLPGVRGVDKRRFGW
ncbi:hypothetical protein FB45DRAFT_141641 [Roridomyces roridus]|uniref:SMP-30/Gluconolactonase/LRE-like region domain-containing protein n=1 Tax=Roridomyces roridus TaxID=1738132 RepID=A0AAD7FJ17_9AGAR|nr:hypothetical protein FB45DRAFT_141641 [Roridomyces roridus]